MTERRPCTICGGAIPPESRTDRTVCSNTCRNKRNRLQESPEALARRLAVKKTKAPEYMRRYRAKRPEAEREWERNRRKRRWRSQPRVVAARKKLRRAARGTSGKKQLWAQGLCRRCGTSFLGSANGQIPAYCSAKCNSADSRERRRARKAGAFVEKVYRQRIFERDGWRCQLCHKPVKRDAVVPHPKAPTIDHIIPLNTGVAAGGTHEPSNVQCAHFLCNSIKSDGVFARTGDQLRLIA